MAFPSNAQIPGAGVGVQVVPDYYYDRQFLDRLVFKLRADQLCEKKKMPKGVGNTIYFTRYDNLAANTTPINPGVVPVGLNMAAAQISATPLQYGDYITLSDAIELKAIDPVVESANQLLAYQAALSIDTLILTTLHTNVTNQFAGGAGTEAGTSAVVTGAELRLAAKTLKVRGVEPMSGDDFIGVFSVANTYDLMSETSAGGFIDVHKYTTSGPLLKGEIGKLWGIRILESPNVQVGVGSGSAPTSRNFIAGKGAVGIVDLAGKAAVQTFRKPLGSAGTADPIDQISTVGHKFWMVVKPLHYGSNSAGLSRCIELVACSAF